MRSLPLPHVPLQWYQWGPSGEMTCSSFAVVQSLSHAWLSVAARTAARQASLSFTISWSLVKLMSIESVISSDYLILRHPLLLLPSVFPSIKVFSDELAFHIRWSKHLPSLGSKEAEHPYCQRRSCGNSNKTLPPFPHSERILLAGAKEETRTPIPAQCNEKHPHRCQRRLTNFLTNLAVTRYLSLLLMGSANENQAKQKVPIRCSVIT